MLSTAFDSPDVVPIGAPGLGFALGSDLEIRDGWLVRSLRVPQGLDGPKSILQGGFAAGVLLHAALAIDPIGAPVTAVDARLHAPTPVGATIEVAVRPTDDAACYQVETRAQDHVLVSGRVELAGHESGAQVYDLAEVARDELPKAQPPKVFTDCWMCGSDNPHPLAQRLFPGYRDSRTVVSGWLAEEPLGDDRGVVDPMVVAAALDCPTGWACAPTIAAMDTSGPLLGGYHVRFFHDVTVMEPLRIVGRMDAVDGRKMSTRGALFDDDGRVAAVVSALQITVDDVASIDAAGDPAAGAV